jgi:hypothetical protein
VASHSARCGGGDGGGTTTLTPAISIALASSSLSVVQGTAGNVTVNLTRTGGFSGDVSIADRASHRRDGVLGDDRVRRDVGDAHLLAVAATTATGATSVTISASATGVTTSSATLALTITTPAVTGNYTLTAGRGPVVRAGRRRDGRHHGQSDRRFCGGRWRSPSPARRTG